MKYSNQLKVRPGPDGIHIFDRSTGANLLIDELRVPRKLWAVAPRHVSIALTNACDLQCPRCFAPKNPAQLDSGRLIEWLHELDSNGCLGVGFGGGEPALYEDLASLCMYAFKRTKLAVTLTTNAYHLDDNLAADLRGNIHFIRVSMDGIGDTYKNLRGIPFSSLFRRFATIRKIAPFGINFLVNAQTFPDLDIATEIADEVGASEFLLLPEQPVDGKGGIDHRTNSALLSWVKSYRGVVPLRISETSANGFPICNPLAQETGLSVYAHIDASGLVKRSSFDRDGVIIGDDGVIQALKELELINGGSR